MEQTLINIWQLTGIVLGLMILIPLLIFSVVCIYSFICSIIDEITDMFN
jgi:hypothetical protein